MSARHESFAQKAIEIDESLREIAALDDLYDDLVRSQPENRHELEIKRDEARFARERMLKLSLHVKNLLASLESKETIK
ncbi:hypothetical protein KY363_01200 [Candidatus Woesearchaeota archaeon]|nr:hypothetical protein [Candidatus Woesearchaeota archaeon]